VFLDTNILIYAVAGKRTNPAEFAIAREIVDEEEFEVSPMILGEFYSVVRRPQNELMTAAQANTWVKEWEEHCRIEIDAGLINAACFLRERYKMQFWDAAHVAASERRGIGILYSQDMSHGQRYGAVTVINPFKVH
jgi:predicted nucleic acid-binding protein